VAAALLQGEPMFRTLCLGLLLSLICTPFLVAGPQASSSLESRRKALSDLLAEQWEYTLRTNPIYASILGDKRWNDKVDATCKWQSNGRASRPGKCQWRKTPAFTLTCRSWLTFSRSRA
jgi:hypothetical protein